MLRPFAHPVACCGAKFETSQTFQPTTPNISFVPRSPKRSTTMLDPFAQLFQHCWGRARSLRMRFCDGLYPSHDALQVPTLLEFCCIPLHTTYNMHAKTELLRPFARSLRQFLGFADEFDNKMTFSKRLNRHCSIPTPFRRAKRKPNQQQFPQH